MNQNKRRVLFICTGLLILLLLALTVSTYYLFFSPTFRLSETGHVYIDRDDTADSVFHKVDRAGNPAILTGFKLLARYYDYPDAVKTGHYAIQSNDNMYRLFRRISQGRQTPVRLSFNNPRTRDRLASVIGKQLMLDSAEIANKLYDSTFCAGQGFREETIISLFIPNTYEIYWNLSTDELFGRMQKEYKTFWNDERLNKAAEIGFTPTEVMTLASIVEEETNNDQEKPVIAGLYINRLHRDMPLQADPTVKFGLQEFDLHRIRGNHLTVDSPYNTYKHTGLPPGPIRIPSIRGIDSVLNYTRHNYLYMCAKEDFSGTHNFAATFAEHQANAKKYWQALNKRKIY